MAELFRLLNEATRPETVSPELREALAAADPYWDKIHAAFSRQFADDMCAAVDLPWSIECEEHFARGFRLGVHLMLEAVCAPGEGQP